MFYFQNAMLERNKNASTPLLLTFIIKRKTFVVSYWLLVDIVEIVNYKWGKYLQYFASYTLWKY